MRQGLISKRVAQGGRYAFMPNPEKAIVSDPNGYVRINNRILETKSNALGLSAYNWYTFVLGMGSYAEVLFEARRVSGSSDLSQAGGVGFNRFSSQDDKLMGSLIDWKKIESDEWRTYHLSIPPDINKPFVALAVGAFTNTIGEYHFRRLEINSFNSSLDSPSVRFGEITGGGTNWGISQTQNGGAYYGIHTVELGSNHLVLRYADVSSWNYPIITGNILVGSGTYGYQVQFGSITRTSCKMYLYNPSGQGVSWKTIPSAKIHVMMMA